MISFPKPDVEQFFRTYVISHFTISKDEKKLIFSSNLNGKFNLWAMDLPNTYPYPLTYNDQNSNFVKIDPQNRYILTGFDKDGDENFQIYALPINGGNPHPILTGDDNEKFYFNHLSKNGERIYYTTTKDNPSFLNIHCYNLKTKEDKLLIKGESTTNHLLKVSPKEQSFAFIKMFSNTHMLAYIKKGEEVFCVTPSTEVAHTVSDILFVDESLIYLVTNYGEDFSYLATFNLESKTFTPIIKLDSEDIRELKWHQQSNNIYIVTEKGVTDKIHVYNIDNGKLSTLEIPVDNVQQLEVTESGNLYLLGRSATKTFNIYKKTLNSDWEALTNNQVLGIPEEDLVEPKVIQYKSYDGLEIEALLFPAKPEIDNGYTIFWPHGGPQHAERKFFRGLFQFLLGRGYTIFAPNFRGSTGYGATFTKLVEGDWGEGPRLDCIAGIEWLFENKISKRDKLFIMGGSYGGYMTLLLAGRHPEYFRAAIDIFGPSNLFTFINSVPEHWKPIMKQWLGDPVEDKERLTKDSPITYLDQMTKPLLVIQGANDPRVVKAESDQIVAALKKKGVEVEYLVLEDEGHGFSKKENEYKTYRLILDFLERHK
ncbi:peptidase S9 [Vulcanibacillus modesticaldus]|uniref:Peptidase S9 n=1 Tax=Vulcanibacillus modesticaldus TaxID=337097 RepID=A0A1D2YX08_9BACI|nr:S9 family peptidase [Vulcanibacillus modesticaldus]OEG00244.1 peptidase S9 [Vulcanibacillus modesticaldus]